MYLLLWHAAFVRSFTLYHFKNNTLRFRCSDPDGPGLRGRVPGLDRGQGQRRDENVLRRGQKRSRGEQLEPAVQSDQQPGDRRLRDGAGQTPTKYSKKKTFPS